MSKHKIHNSTSIHSVAYSAGNLSVYFHSDPSKAYTYQLVPRKVYMQLVAASSTGRAYNALIRGKYSSAPTSDKN
jgi:hypothetical protein